MHTQLLSHIWLFAAPWTIAHQVPLSMGFCRQEYWSGQPFLLLVDLPNPEIELVSPALAGGFFTTEPPGSPTDNFGHIQKLGLYQQKATCLSLGHSRSWQLRGCALMQNIDSDNTTTKSCCKNCIYPFNQYLLRPEWHRQDGSIGDPSLYPPTKTND